MRLLFILHMYPPIHNAGGETTVHAAMREMVKRGHEVQVIARPHSTETQFDPYVFEGVNVVRPPSVNEHEWLKGYITEKNPDLLLTHLDLTFQAMQLALDLGKPLAHFVHNSMQLKHHRVNPLRCQLAIFNSEWVAQKEKWQGSQIVLHPVVEPERYQCERGAKITLVNPTPGKGADTFYALADALPDCEFLTVKSVYGEQIAPPNIDPRRHPNVETMEHTADIREVFRKTAIILMPSLYESYGRVAVEGACAGIPSIVHPTEGLLEALGAGVPPWGSEYPAMKRENPDIAVPRALKGGWVSGAGIFCDRDDIDSWKAQVERLLTDDVYYRSRVDAARKLAVSLNPEKEFDRLEEALMFTSRSWNKEEEMMSVPMWTPDARLWETSDGKFVREIAGRIPKDAIRLWGLDPIPEERAIASGLIEPKEAKAVEAPAENKAIDAPQENKSAAKKTRKKKAA